MSQLRLRPFTLGVLSLVLSCNDEPSKAKTSPPVLGPEVAGTAAAYDWAGYSAVGAGDVNGDGKDDLLVTSHASGVGGRVALFYGPVTTARTQLDADAIFVGEYGFENLGDSIARAGGCDVDGDGKKDILLGGAFGDVSNVSRSPSVSGDNNGKAYLFLGRVDLRGERPASTADVVFEGESPWDTAGSTVACLGDLDGDGLDEIAIAAKRSSRGATRAGAVYLLYGRKTWPKSLSLGAADAVLVGSEPFEGAGYAVASAGDVDGDGHRDVIVGAPNASADGEDAGVAYLVRPRGARLAGVARLADETRLRAPEAGLRVGWAVDAAGDVDGDGFGDVIIGSMTSPLRKGYAGGAFLFRGARDVAKDVDLLRSATRLDGERAGDLAGISVAGIGDMNGDGLADVLVGAIKATGDAPSSGRVYLVEGRRSWPATLALADARFVASGMTTLEHFGESLARGGDLDGDGQPDFVVSAKSRNTGAIASGAVDIFFHGRKR